MAENIKPKWQAHLERGRLVIHDKTGFYKYLEKFKPGQALDVVVGVQYKRRTQGDPGEETNFNGYWWAVPIRMISDEMGELDDNVTHNMLQMMFNKKGMRVLDPETKQMVNIEVPRGTKYLSGIEFAELCSKVRMWASLPKDQGGLGIYIPEPHEAHYDV